MSGEPLDRIEAVAVVVPARDEEDTIEACLDSVRAALDRLPSTIATGVTVVLDRCVDTTAKRVAVLAADWPEVVTLRVAAAGGFVGTSPPDGQGPVHVVAGTGVGALRDLGVRDTLRRLAPVAPRSVWLLHTDADSTVPPDWAVDHLELAAAGAVGVAGMVELAAEWSSSANRRHEQLVVSLVDGDRHHHVYGANFGVRGDAYLAVGGFPVDDPGEDHGLWQELAMAGLPLRQPSRLRVVTSARLQGRATGGLADLLWELDGGSTQTVEDRPLCG